MYIFLIFQDMIVAKETPEDPLSSENLQMIRGTKLEL